MRILVLAAYYPDDKGNIPLYYIHTRNAYYVRNGIKVDVINFSASYNYELDGVNVLSYGEFKPDTLRNFSPITFSSLWATIIMVTVGS